MFDAFNLLRDFGVAIFIIIFSFFYYKLVSGFLSDVTIRRLTKTSFDVNTDGFLDLFFAYSIGIAAYIVIYFYKLSLDSSYTINPIIFISAGFGLLYLGRILTRQQGSIFGKLHFSSLFVVVFIIILIQIIAFLQPNKLTFETIYNTSSSYMNFFEENKNFILIAVIFLSTLGEIALSIIPPAPKSLLAVTDKFPSDFKVICGLHPRIDGNNISFSQIVNSCLSSSENASEISAIRAKLKKIFDDKTITNIKCVTKSLVLAEDILEFIKNDEKTERNMNCKILIAPKYKAIEDYEQAIKKKPISLGVIITGFINRIFKRNSKYAKYFAFVNGYNLRESKILECIKNCDIQIKECYFGSVIFIIIENNIGEKKLLFSIRDKGPMMKRVGLYTEEPYVINIFNDLFDTKWDNTK